MKTIKGATLVGSLIAISILITTAISTLNLQAGIIKAKFFLKYDNTANLLASEGVEIVRAKYVNDKTSVVAGTYAMDYNVSNSTTCANSSVNASCALSLDSSGYTVNTNGRTFYRFIEILINTEKINGFDSQIVTINSTVIVKNLRGNAKQYKVSTKLYEL
jgi:hypothetical protein